MGCFAVVIFSVVAYFLLVCAVLALVLLPTLRERVWGQAVQWRRQGRARMQAWGQRREQGLRSSTEGVSDVVQRLVRFMVLNWMWLLGGAAVLLSAPLLSSWLRLGHAFEGYDHTASREMDPKIAALLAGEQLVPPPPLPPELFLTKEVEQVYPMAARASRQWELLDAEFQQKLLVVFRLMKEQHGYEMVLIEGYRSPERQNQLAAMGGHVTRAGGGQSYHQYGLAADCAFLRNGKVVISEADPWAAKGYELYGQMAQSVGMVWGGSWRSIKDLGHVELRRPGVIKPG